jgi:pantetheine-phosphate adenylyltransferase
MKRVAIFAGSFNPLTIGHKDIYDQAEAIFGEGNVLLALGKNPEKKSLDFAREKEIKNNNPSMNVGSYDGFLHDFVTKLEKDGYDVTLVRGLRNGADLQYEQNQLAFIRDYKPEIKVMFLLCDKSLEHISSSAVRAIQKIDPFGAEKYIAKD